VRVFFDLNGTLVDPGVLLEPRELALAALDEANMLGMVETLAGRRPPFRDLLESALRRLLARAGRAPDEAEAALERLASMPAFPDAAQALALLRAAGFTLGVLTQSSGDAANTVLANAGLELDEVLSTTPLKPHPAAYAPADGGWLVAAHWWDVAGAARAGLRTAWVSRDDVAYPSAAPEPDVRAGDLLEAARKIVAAS
jgi:2-haloacid dehalogenase